MRLVLISDTHSRHKHLKIPDGDVLIHAGDFTGIGDEKDFIQFNSWLGTLPHKYKLITAGNHDKLAETNRNLAKSLISNGTLLLDESFEIDGVNFYFSPYTPLFRNWSFMLPRSSMKYVWEKIPENTDVLVTHGPPHGILDVVYNRFNVNAGCEALRDRVLEIKPKIHIFGHIHEGRGEFKNKHTHYINASSLNKNYDVSQEHSMQICI